MSSLVVTTSPSPSEGARAEGRVAHVGAGEVHPREHPARDLDGLRRARRVNESKRPPELLGDHHVDPIHPAACAATRAAPSTRSAPERRAGAARPSSSRRSRRPSSPRGPRARPPPAPPCRRAARKRAIPSSTSLSRGCASPRSHGSSIASSSHVPQSRTSCPRRCATRAMALPMYPAPRTVTRIVRANLRP